VAARANLARALLLSGDEAAARAHLAILRTADPEDKQGATLGEQTNRLFELHMALGELDDAAADARRLTLAEGIPHAQGVAAQAAIDLSRGAFDEGLAKLAAAAGEYERLHVDSLALHTHWELAAKAYELGRYREAIAVGAHIRRLKADQGHSLAATYARHILVVETLARIESGPAAGDPAALDSLRRQVETLPPPMRAYFEMLRRYRDRDWAGVVSAYRQVETRVVSLALAYPAAQALERLGRPQDAAALYQRLATHPNAWDLPYRRGQAWLRLGILRQQAGDAAGARAAFESLLELWDQAPRDLPELRQAEQRLKALAETALIPPAAGSRSPAPAPAR
jgi:tetratricopeptide (TPR) repeat protein